MFKKYLNRFSTVSIVGKYIYVNVAVYIFVVFIAVFSLLLNVPSVGVEVARYVELPASLPRLLSSPWTLFTYMFLHLDLWHILWNMLALYAFGKIFLNFYSVRHFVGTYILGGLIGGLFFVSAYNLFPYFAPLVGGATLVGASASVLAVVTAAATRSPNYRVVLLFFGSVKLSTIAIATVLISFLMLAGSNAGGNFAHIGGAFAGWLIAYMLNKGRDITEIVNRPLDFLSTIFKKHPGRRKMSRFNFVRGEKSASKRASDYAYNARKKADEAEIDKILEKIKKGGYASLSETEKKRLFEASKK